VNALDAPLRRTAIAAALALAALPLAACGQDQPDYCATLKTEQKTLTALANRADSRSGDVLTPTLAAFEHLRAAAPQQLSDEWDTVVFAYRALADAVKQAGIDPASYRPGKRPDGVTRAEARHLAALAAQLDAPRVIDAVTGIEDEARQVCSVDLRG
jgi:hypothetical protein